MNGHHAGDGWFFCREADASVTIEAASWPGGPHVTLDPDTWASTVAAVSAAGGTREAYRRALQLHDPEGV